ncbi:MAG: hypothetical protein J7M25_03960 [Deltaproteobacteria bacterium]|nr:hypothetical protein [Deltaproteobacteria bacterium]
MQVVFVMLLALLSGGPLGPSGHRRAVEAVDSRTGAAGDRPLVSSSRATTNQAVPSMSAGACHLGDLLASLMDPGSRRKVADDVEQSTQACRTEMLEMLKTAAMGPKEYDAVRRVLARAGVAMPPFSGWFSVPKLKPGQVPAYRRVDLLKALVAISEPRGSDMRKAYRDALKWAFVLRGLSAQRSTAVAEPLVRFTFRLVGFAFRVEVNRGLENLGAYAVPGLLALASQRQVDWKRDRRRYLTRAFARYILGVLVEGDPVSALASADHSLKLELLAAYGRYHVADAVRSLIVYTNEEDPALRRAARKALSAYFVGPRPRVHRRRLKLPGGRETTDRRLLFMTYRQRAVYEIRKELDRLTGGIYDRDARGAGLLAVLFSAQNRQRAGRRDRAYAKVEALWAAGKKKQAIWRLERLISKGVGPVVGRRASTMYASMAMEALESGRVDASIRYRLVSALVTGEPLASALADVAYLESLKDQAGGRRDDALAWCRTSLLWNRDYEGCFRAVVALSGARLETGQVLLALAVVFGLALLCLWVSAFLLRRRRG